MREAGRLLFGFILLGVAVFALLTAAGSSSAAPGGEWTGRVVSDHGDDFAGKRAFNFLTLDTGRERFSLTGPGAAWVKPGMAVRVKGIRQGGTLELANAAAVQQVGGGSLAGVASVDEGSQVKVASATNRRVAVLLINFINPTPPPPPTPTPCATPTATPTSAASTPSPTPTACPSPTPTPTPAPTPTPPPRPWTKAQVRDTYFSGSRSMAAYYNELSNGQLTVSGDVFGWYTLTVKTSTCDYNGWGSAARTAATAAGVDLSRYTNISYVFPGTRSCSWGGLANIGSPTTKSQLHSWINGYGTNLYIVTHELGHNFGSHHASTVRCSSGGVAAQLSRASGCSWDEYGDPFDVMGAWANTRLMNNFGRRQIGTLGTTDQQTVTTTGEYRLATAATDGGTPRILRVQRSSDSFFYLEYRRPYGLFDSWSSSDPAVNGVMIRLAPDSRRAQAQLIDTKPSTSTFADAPLSVGRTFHDPFRDITIIVRALSSTRATLYIQVGPDVTAPSVPSSISASVGGPTTVNLSWGPATDEIGVTKYRIVRNGLRLGAVTGRSYSDASAPQGTLRYEVSARDAAGNWGPPATIEVHLPDTIPPSAPGGVSISQSETGAEATVSWTAATDNIAVTGYRVWRDGTEVGTSSSLSFTDRGLTPGGQYHYEVAAYDAAGNVGARAGASVQMQGDAVPPVVVAPATRLRGNVQISKAAVHAAVRWSATDASGVARYQLQQSIDGGKWRGVSLPGPRVTQMKLSLAPTSSYRFRVRATDGLGNVSAWQQGPKFSIVTRRSSAKAITYGPGWQLVSATNAYSGALKYAQRTTSASLTFAGRSIAWVAPLGPKRGRAEVYIDGKRRAVVDLYAAKNSPRRVVFTTSWDASASRTLEIRLSGSGSPLRVDVDAFVFLR